MKQLVDLLKENDTSISCGFYSLCYASPLWRVTKGARKVIFASSEFHHALTVWAAWSEIDTGQDTKAIAFNQGYDSISDGRTNPYPKKSSEYNFWNDGYDTAR